jgi:multidrug efflux pump subunit AcrA (membrane-fusion protein)/YHS domain-containing protein
MKKRFQILILLLIAAGAFLAGSWLTYQGVGKPATAERKILHYVDPMNPALKFDHPGIAPCGMPLEPVYADQGDAATGGADLRASLPPGTIRISPEKQQLIGVKTMTVEKAPWTHTLRALGRVTPDETLVYRINAATEGWIEKTLPVTTGSQVKENELLATLSFFSLEYRTLVQNYFNLINLGDSADDDLSPLVNNPQYSQSQLRQMRQTTRYAGRITQSAQIDYFRKSLYNYGITPYQLEEIERTRTFPEEVEIRAPAAGFILFRNVSPGLRLNRGEEIFRIADLSRVWILADIFENEAAYFKPGTRVKMELPYQKKTFYAEVSPVLPQFDPATRTLKVRLVAENPGYVMRPDMFVNAELAVSGPSAMVVPVDAVLDSGLKKTVFVDRGSGFLEPRQVETGRTLGERVEIVRGLMPGEKIVVSGNFLIDSEARMQQAASGIFGKIGRDPVCGMNIDEDRAQAEGNFLEYKGKTYFFCEPQCREDFRKEPEKYLKATPGPGAMPMAGSPDAPAERLSPKPAAAVPKADGAKAPPEHAEMPGRPAAPPKAIPSTTAAPAVAVPKAGQIFPPAADAPEMGARKAPLPGSPGATPGTGPMPPKAAPIPGLQTGASATPATPAARAPRINLRTQRYRFPETAPQEGTPQETPWDRPKLKGFFPPADARPGRSRELPALPGPGDMPMPGSPDAAPMPGPDAGPMFPPAVDTPDMGPGAPSFPGPGDMPLPEPQGSAPMAVPPGAAPGPGAMQPADATIPAIQPGESARPQTTR